MYSGSLEVCQEGVAFCEYCGARQTLPKFSNEKVVNLYERASHFQRENDFERAADLYEQILLENRKDAEIYWSLVLCRYGVEYVEDPNSQKRVPTVNRTQLQSILDTAMTQVDINQESGVVFQKWDMLLNEVYQYLKTIMTDSEFALLHEEEIAWIGEKEAAIEAAGAEWGGGSGEPMARNMTAIEYTKARCYYLISLIK